MVGAKLNSKAVGTIPRRLFDSYMNSLLHGGIIRCFFLVILNLSLLSCEQQDSPKPRPQVSSTAAVSGVKAGQFAPGQLETHYLKHGYQFGEITLEEYWQQAQELLNAQPGGDIQQKVRPNGDIEHYRVSTGEFAVMTTTGRIRTYFKTNQKYWMKQ